MKDVSFAYGKKEVLHHVNFHLKEGEMLALAGPSGSGKSTIASLLTRFWDVLLRRGSLHSWQKCQGCSAGKLDESDLHGIPESVSFSRYHLQ